jgi:hypothetical protein
LIDNACGVMQTSLSHVVLAASLAGLVVALPPRAGACDSTSCSIVMRGQDGVSTAGSLRVDLSFRHFTMDKPLSRVHAAQIVVPWVDFAGERIRSNYHVENPSEHNLLQLDLSYGLSSRVTVTAALPLVSRSFGFRHSTASSPAAPTDPHGHVPFDPTGSFVDQTYDTEGIGDLQAGARYALHVGPKSRLVAGLAARVPTGRYQLSGATVGIFHPAFQPGTGAWGAAASAKYSHQEGGAGWSLSGSYQKSLENGLGYTPGDEGILAAGLNYDLSKRVASSVQIKLNRLTPSRYLDIDVPSTGSTFVYLTPGFRLNAGSGLSAYTFVPLPIFQKVRDSQLVPQITFLAGIAKDF